MVRLVLPNQMFHQDYSESMVLMEHPRFFTDYDFHKQKLVLHRASMKNFEQEFREVEEYVEYDGDLDKVFRENDEVLVYRPEDHELRDWLQEKCREYDTELVLEESPLFLTSMDWNREYFQSHEYFQLSYYKEQRKRLSVLINDDGGPVGGKWSYDPENREKMPEDHEPPEIPKYSSEVVEEAKNYVESEFANNPGSLEDFIFPVSRKQAQDNLEDFLDNRMEYFGRFQDAIDEELDYGYHSMLSSALNIGLITPREVVEKTLEKHEEHDYPLNSLEGFLRQIIGWREFIRALYHLEPDMKQHNFFNADNGVPEEFYTGETGLKPFDEAVNRVQRNAYTHHIERLMIHGNLMLLLEIEPDEVHEWFMEMFIDSYDWVMTPNVYGMSQYSYSEMMTKPYISSSNYILKMSNYEEDSWCEEWDGLYWNFIKKHEDKISSINRMSFMTSTLGRMNEDTVEEHVSNAERVRERLGLE